MRGAALSRSHRQKHWPHLAVALTEAIHAALAAPDRWIFLLRSRVQPPRLGRNLLGLADLPASRVIKVRVRRPDLTTQRR
ncbi:hypothetical protein [Kibdelosporangium philippinense]|uniref:hypothetical protein n=1 Tax=Kibdelosporangium philippinense TaxID=211113 RepID=UPI00360DE808